MPVATNLRVHSKKFLFLCVNCITFYNKCKMISVEALVHWFDFGAYQF